MSTAQSQRAARTYLLCVLILAVPMVAWMALAGLSVRDYAVPIYMFVPAVSALLARLITGVKITFGRPSIRTLGLALVPPLVVAGVYGLASLFGWLDVTPEVSEPLNFVANLVASVLLSCVLAFGEELGWRGYLLPQLRMRHGYLRANTLVVVIWFVYHLPVMLIPGYYSNPGIPLWASLVLFAVAVTGFSFYVGAVWEVHHDLWAPVLAHGWWNYLIQTVWPMFFAASSPWLMGEFGILPAIAMTGLAVVVAPRAAKRNSEPLAGAAEVAVA